MNYEDRLKRIVGHNDIFWFNIIKRFIDEMYENKDEGMTNLEKLYQNKQKFSDFTKKLVEKQNDFQSVKDEFFAEKNNKIAAMEIAKTMNYRMHAENLSIPVLDKFEVKNADNPQTVLLAIGNGLIEQLTSDGYVDESKFDERIDLVIKNAKEFMKENACQNIDNSFIYYEDYSNGVFNFKLYFSDMIIPLNGQYKVIRQLNAYFVEPRMHDFYQLSISAGPFKYPTEDLKTGMIDLTNDSITHSLDTLMKQLMDNLKYKH